MTITTLLIQTLVIQMLPIQMAMADWTETERKQNYVQCLYEVSDFKDGYLQDPLLAHDICVCAIDVLEEHLPSPSSEAIIQFTTTDIEKFEHCRKEYQSRRKTK